MGHYCRICGRERANEKFSGRGHRTHVCKDCASKPKTELAEIEHEEAIFGFLHQSHVSAKNLDRLHSLQTSTNARISDLAITALEVATVTPFKKRRLLVLAKKRPDLMKKLEETGLIVAHHMDWEANTGVHGRLAPRRGSAS